MITALKQHSSKISLRKLAYGLLVTLPIVIYVFKFSILNRNGIFGGEDWDYFAQSYEAARVSILHYHQFPWWNPWMNGGQPLFANPQFGLFSLQMPLVLLFGTVAGLHYSILLYFILGFWGMYRLLQRLGSNSRLVTVLLSYIWIFSSFAAWHLGGGQLTFAIYLLSPWAFLTVLNIRKGHGWLWFGLVATLMVQTAAHYVTLEALVICSLIAAVQLIRQIYGRHLKTFKTIWPLLLPYIYAGILIFLLCGVRLFYTFQFTHEYPRLQLLDPAESLRLFITSLISRHPVDPSTITTFVNGVTYQWGEYADYLGVFALGLFCYLVVKRCRNLKSASFKEWAILAATLLVALTSLGAFASFSPFSLMHRLPIFDQMRVPSRFICWVVLGVVLFMIKLPRKPFVYVILVVAVIDIFTASYPILNYSQHPYRPVINESRQFQQYEFFQTNPRLGQIGIMSIQNLRLLRATQQNYGEIYGYEPILNTGEYYYVPDTTRCGINKGCPFVITKNAAVTRWSPLHIGLRRTAPGDIKINMNPGKVWLVNGKSPFKTYRILELQRDFVIKDSSKNIEITFRPVLR